MIAKRDPGIHAPAWAVPIIAAVTGWAAGALVASNFAAYWRPALVPVVLAVGGAFVNDKIVTARAARHADEAAEWGGAVAVANLEPPG